MKHIRYLILGMSLFAIGCDSYIASKRDGLKRYPLEEQEERTQERENRN